MGIEGKAGLGALLSVRKHKFHALIYLPRGTLAVWSCLLPGLLGGQVFATFSNQMSIDHCRRNRSLWIYSYKIPELSA